MVNNVLMQDTFSLIFHYFTHVILFLILSFKVTYFDFGVTPNSATAVAFFWRILLALVKRMKLGRQDTVHSLEMQPEEEVPLLLTL